MKISASFLSLPKNLKEIDNLNIDYIHCDIMDGEFVKNQTTFFSILEDSKKSLNHKLDVHLMVSNYASYISLYSSLKPEYITVHLEIGDTFNIIDCIKKREIKIGLAIKPNTSVEELIPYLEHIDLVLVMSVEPGEGGQKFNNIAKEKIDFLYNYRKENNLNFLIEVDGGINNETIKEIKNADIAVVGSYISLAEDMNLNLNKLKEDL